MMFGASRWLEPLLSDTTIKAATRAAAAAAADSFFMSLLQRSSFSESASQLGAGSPEYAANGARAGRIANLAHAASSGEIRGRAVICDQSRVEPSKVRRRSLLVGVMLAAAAAGLVVVLLARSGEGHSVDQAPVALARATVGASIGVGGAPVAVAVGGGSVWVIDAARGTLSAIDARTRRVKRHQVQVSGGPFAVAVGEGAVWVACGDGTIRAFDVRHARPVGRAAHVRGANGLAAGAGGVWVTSRLARTLTRIDPLTHRTGRPIRVGAGPADVAVGAGSVWVANADGGSVTRVDPRTGRPDRPIAVGGRQVRGLAVGEGGVWVARATGVDADRTQVVRIDSHDRKVHGRPIGVTGAVPLDIAAGAGSVWITDVGGLRPSGRLSTGQVTRVDPRRHRIAGLPLRVGKRPSAIATGAGGAWVANADDGTVTPISVTPAPSGGRGVKP